MFPFLRSTYIKRVIATNSVRKGLIGGSGFWRLIWLIRLARRNWTKVSKKGEMPIVHSEAIGEGEAWTMVHVPEESRRGRGEGRKFLIGPKRTKPKATSVTSAAMGYAGKKLVEAGSAKAMNGFLGAKIVEDPPLSRRQRRKQKKSAKADGKRS